MLLKLSLPDQPDLMPWVRGWLAMLLWPEANPASQGELTPLETSLAWSGPCALAVAPPRPNPFTRLPVGTREIQVGDLLAKIWMEVDDLRPQWLLSLNDTAPATLAFIKLQAELRVGVVVRPEVMETDWARSNIERWHDVLMGSGMRFSAVIEGSSLDWTMPARRSVEHCHAALRALSGVAHFAPIWKQPEPEPARLAHRRAWAQLALTHALALAEQTPEIPKWTLRFAQSALYGLDPATAHLARSYPLSMDLTEYVPDWKPSE